MMKSFAKTYVIKASPTAVFSALTDPAAVARWSGSPATMSADLGAFSLWGGSIHGVNLEVRPDLLVQHWKEESWAEFSTVTIRLTAKGAGTEVELVHEGIPDKSLRSIKAGWDDYYLLPLKEHVEGAGA